MRELQITPTITNRETQSVETYLSEIGKVDLISPQEEVTLAQKIKQGDQAALNKLVSTNLRFVVSVAKKYQNQGLPLSDLINEGNLGLIKAAYKFDETRGFKFISFAVWWIRQSIMFAIAENSRMIRLPMNQIGTLTRLNKAVAMIEQQEERMPTPEELADFLGTSKVKVADAMHYAPRTASYDAPYAEEEYSMLDRLGNNEPAPDEGFNLSSFQAGIKHLLGVLTHREREIIELTFGLNNGYPLQPTDIAPMLRLSPERIRQIRNKGIKKLKEHIPAIEHCF